MGAAGKWFSAIYGSTRTVSERRWSVAVIMLLTGALSSALILSVAWPGFMSFDSLRALRGARQGVEDALWPPMVSYIWWMVELIYPGPVGMLFVQNMILGVSIGWFVYVSRAPLGWAITAPFVVFLLPPVLGPSLVVWKDIEMAAFLMAGYAAYVSSLDSINKKSLLAVCAVMLGIACLIRHNAFFAAVPLIMHWALTGGRPLSRGLLAAVIATVVICFAPGVIFNNYRLPDLKPISTRRTDFTKSLAVLDTVGASICSGRNFFDGFIKQPFDVDFLRNNYSARHVSENEKIFARIDFESFDALAAYRAILRDAPQCLLAHKIQLGRFLFGINDGPVFYITHGQIDDNEFGYSLQPSQLRDMVVKGLIAVSYTPLAAPVTYLSVAVALIVAAAWRRIRIRVGEALLFISGLAITVSNVFVLPAADLRYSYWPLVAWSVVSLLIVPRIVSSGTPVKDASDGAET